MVLNKVITTLLICYCCTVESASILALFSSLSFSDHIVFRNYVSLLVHRGHTVVVMTPYPDKTAYPDPDKVIELTVAQESSAYWDEYKSLMTNTDDYYSRLKEINEFTLKLAIAQFRSKAMMSFLSNPNVKFDLVITEADVPLLYGAADKYQVPHIAITTSSGRIHQYENKGAPTHPVLYPDVNSLNYRNITSWQKINEINRHFRTRNEYYTSYLPLCELAAKKIFGIKRSLQEIEYNIDLLFVANNPALIGNRPSPPSIVYVDRMHIRAGFSLPEDLWTAIDSATKGVIYFSLGALQESEQLSPQLLNTLADGFRELPFLVLWKIGNTTMINKPENVISNVWFPQQEVLAHPNVKAFITNGGSRSLEEALYYEVPIIGLPNVKSRKVFIEEITRHGAGEILDPYYLEKDTLKQIISTVVSEEKYKNALSKLKSEVIDPLISGPDKAVWWTEYVLQKEGAKNLRTPAVGLSSFKYYMLDICSVILVISIILNYVSYYIFQSIISRVRRFIRQKFDKSGKFKAL